MIPLDRVRELLSLAPGPHGGTLMDTSMVHDLARDVLTLADALATAERERDEARAERDTARSALDGLTAAVRAEREAERGHAAVRADDASRGRHLRAAEAAVDKARHATDALLSAAPAPTTVPAMVVRAYLRADARSATGTHADATALAAARTALDAALERRA